MNIGIIGCGNISNAYFQGGKQTSLLQITACADLHMDAARAKADEHGCEALTVTELLAREEIELVINLTIPQAHLSVSEHILDAGKHVYLEKPLGLELEAAETMMKKAEQKGLRIGCAPDTFLFGNAQTARKLVDEGAIGRPVAGMACMLNHGHESWHPNPGFYYDHGGGPMLDMGPYYISALVNLLGPVRSVCGKTTRGFEQRTATSDGAKGQILPVKTDTHLTGVLEFDHNVLVTLTTSFDVYQGDGAPLQLFGTEGTIQPGDPNNYRKNVRLFQAGDEEFREIEPSHPANARMIGVVDLVEAIQNDRPHRASGQLALHTLEVMLAFELSGKTGRHINIRNLVEQPSPLPPGLKEWVAE